MYEISALYTYPVKSCRGVPLSSMSVDALGPQYDRRFMLIGEDFKHVTQRTDPLMAKIDAVFDGAVLRLDFAQQSFVVPVADFGDEVRVSVWSDEVDASALPQSGVGLRLNAALSLFLNKSVRLVYMPLSTYRRVDPEFSSKSAQVGFADGFPILLCSEASLVDLNSRLSAPVEMERFRPNIVVSGGLAFAESDWRKIRIGDIEFDSVKPCSRCSMITLDENGVFSKEPLKTLASYRTNSFGACFGENLVHRGKGMLELGMSVEILE
jgi:uncharacterized protein YcbX